MTNEQLLAEAKRRYPIGTKFRSAHLEMNKGQYFIVTSNNFEINGNGLVSLNSFGHTWNKDHNPIEGSDCHYDRVVYCPKDEKWAEIINDTKTLNNKKQNKMRLETDFKHKKIFHTFEYNDRDIMLVVIHNIVCDTPYLSCGYSVIMPVSKKKKNYKEGLSEAIAIGRASKAKSNLLPDLPNLDKSLSNKFVLKAIATNIEHKIKNGKIVIKGIR